MLKTVPYFAQQEILASFDSGAISRGKKYFKDGKVENLQIFNEGLHLISKVMGSGHARYQVNVNISFSKNDEMTVVGLCSCYVGYNCKHVVATLLAAKKHNSQNLSVFSKKPSKKSQANEFSEVNQWVNDFETALFHTHSSTKLLKERHSILYFLKVRHDLRKNTVVLEVSLKMAKGLKEGGYVAQENYSFTSASQQKYLDPIDEVIVNTLYFIKSRTQLNRHSSSILLGGNESSQLLKDILNTGRSFFDENSNEPVRFQEQLKPEIELKWVVLTDGCQVFKAFSGENVIDVCVLDELWYVNQENNHCGIIHADSPINVLEKLLEAPPMPFEMIPEVTQYINTALPSHKKWRPRDMGQPVIKEGIMPTPEIRLGIESIRRPVHGYYSETYQYPTAEILFDYEGHMIPFSLGNISESIAYVDDDVVYVIKRNFDKEKEYLLGLHDFIKLGNLEESHHNSEDPVKLAITSIVDESDFIPFVVKVLPQLERKGWHIVRNHPNFLEVLHDEDINWYSALDEKSEYDYFGFRMGIMVDGEQIDILPIISNIIRNTYQEDFDKLADNDVVPMPLPNGKILAVPYSRIKPILKILIELYDSQWNGQGPIMLSRAQAALLIEIEKAFQSAQLRWFGGEKLRDLGKKLAEFKSIKTIHPPKTFHAALRNYQQEGVNWLQFLREYQLNGILADDMGLGKTVQTLAHLSIEKDKNRMQEPTLIIAPTSLMTNWRLEAEQFTPHLKVLIYHGDERHVHSNDMAKYDVILTTYPLLSRDKEIFLKNEYYYLILDEAQFIKNRKAKSTQIAHQIKAKHRLCLTGTPMENHLGELWSLFHFLMPGFLGEHLTFKKLFQTPIEKYQDSDRQKALSERIKPFMLHRKKREVALELPEKTEIIRHVELQRNERDLYESIRLSMEKKVVEAIAQKGLARSHIIILTALLKLRQACCHPKLLKLHATKNVFKHSAKLEWLRETLPGMIEEGRRILLFSQFTSMLALIEDMLAQQNIDYVKLTGATRHRSKPIETFQKGDVPVFLISLKAGGTGLNLTAADTVIHYDPWWNPAVEAQATDRAHRIGQRKTVFVYKLIAAGTIEETIQQMQQKKRGIIEGLLSDQNDSKLKLSSKDLESLFKPLV